jgi:hypothetical protein
MLQMVQRNYYSATLHEGFDDKEFTEQLYMVSVFLLHIIPESRTSSDYLDLYLRLVQSTKSINPSSGVRGPYTGASSRFIQIDLACFSATS